MKQAFKLTDESRVVRVGCMLLLGRLRARGHPPTEAKRQSAGERAAGQHQRNRDNGETRDGLRRREGWIGRRSGYVRRHASQVEEEPRRSVAQHEGRQDSEGHCGAVALGASPKEPCRHPASHRRENPEANEDDEAGESIGEQEV